MSLLVYIGIALIVVLFLTGAPLAIAFCVGSSIIALYVMGMPLANLAQIFFSSINSYPLLACPFFILAGNLILRSGGMVPLRDFMQAVFGHWPGGLAVASLVFAAFLGSISGSSAACLAILGTIVLPILVDTGYDRAFGAGMSVVAGELGLLIPPSMFFIIFGALNQISIADLFLAGIGPGILTTFFMSIIAIIISKRRKYPIAPLSSWKVKGGAFIRVLPVLIMPIVVLGGIYAGIFSPTQAAAVSVFYAIGIGIFIYRVLDLNGIMESLVETAKLSSMIYLLVIGGDIMSKMLGYLMLPQMITDWVISMELGPLEFLLVVEVLLLAMGFFFSSIPMVIVVLPLFLPSVRSLGIDPVFYGLLAILNSLIGEITPPFGPQLWFAVPICREKMGPIIREAWPFLGAMVLVMLITTFIPDIAMYLVNMFR
jgi:C4-dicarboxylate transporter, DctM subunit